SFIVLYVVRGLGRSPSVASAVIAVVAIAYVVGAPIAAQLADRYRISPALRVSSLIYGVGLVAGVFPRTLAPLLVGLPLVAFAGAITMTLPQALAFTVAPPGSQGAAAGLLDFSRGLGAVLVPNIWGAPALFTPHTGPPRHVAGNRDSGAPPRPAPAPPGAASRSRSGVDLVETG